MKCSYLLVNYKVQGNTWNQQAWSIKQLFSTWSLIFLFSQVNILHSSNSNFMDHINHIIFQPKFLQSVQHPEGSVSPVHSSGRWHLPRDCSQWFNVSVFPLWVSLLHRLKPWGPLFQLLRPLRDHWRGVKEGNSEFYSVQECTFKTWYPFLKSLLMVLCSDPHS